MYDRQELLDLDEEIAVILGTVPAAQRKLVTHHLAFGFEPRLEVIPAKAGGRHHGQI